MHEYTKMQIPDKRHQNNKARTFSGSHTVPPTISYHLFMLHLLRLRITQKTTQLFFLFSTFVCNAKSSTVAFLCLRVTQKVLQLLVLLFFFFFLVVFQKRTSKGFFANNS